MYSKAQMAKKYLVYWLRASNGKGHGVHSPFVFDFITKVLTDKRHFYCYDTIEIIRRQLKENKNIITVEDFGAGSRVLSQQQKMVAAIAASSLKPKKYSRLLFRMVDYFQPSTIVELGTSFGVTAAYLASGNANAKVVTMEGATAIANIAQQNFALLRLKNIQLITGNFDDTLPEILLRLPAVDFAFIDGNHRKAPTLGYFNQLLSKAHEHSVFIFDDIHWSAEMEAAWNEIKAHDAVTVSIDLFFIGAVFFRKENKAKQSFAIRF